MRQLDPAHGNADQVLALFADQLALGQKFAQIFPDASFDDLAKALVIFFDLKNLSYAVLRVISQRPISKTIPLPTNPTIVPGMP
jgi:hypothetical protein